MKPKPGTYLITHERTPATLAEVGNDQKACRIAQAWSQGAQDETLHVHRLITRGPREGTRYHIASYRHGERIEGA